MFRLFSLYGKSDQWRVRDPLHTANPEYSLLCHKQEEVCGGECC